MPVVSQFGVVVDALAFLSVGIIDVVLFTSVQPFKRGFFCDDESIKYPRLGKETVSDTVLVLIALLPAVMIIIVEGCCHFFGASRDTCDDVLKCGPFSIKAWLHRLLCRVFVYGFGGLLNWMLTESCKLFLGRLRPFFLDVCQPNSTLVKCNQGYIMEDVCTGDPQLIREARLSFPSGHASGAMYAMVFLALYIQVMVTRNHLTLLKTFLQAACLVLAFFCGLSRIRDLFHHWGDVLAGFILGAVIALCHATKALKSFKKDAHLAKAGELPTYCRSCAVNLESQGRTCQITDKSHPRAFNQTCKAENTAF